MENLRVLTPEDLPACLRLGVDRGWSEEPEKWAFLLRVGTGFGLFDGAELVGTTIVTRFGDEHAAVSMVLVASSHGGRGLGRRLVEHALAFADTPVVSLHATSYGKPLRVADDGFVATWRNGPVTMVGPVVAPSVGRAAELVADVAVGATVRVDVRDPALGAWLEAHGVVPRFTAELMVRGAFSGDRARLYAPVMQALG